MTEFQALITGAVGAGLIKASAPMGPFLIDVETPMVDGNYTNTVIVTGRESGEKLRITIEPMYDTPESVAEKMQGATAALEAAQRHLG